MTSGRATALAAAALALGACSSGYQLPTTTAGGTHGASATGAGVAATTGNDSTSGSGGGGVSGSGTGTGSSSTSGPPLSSTSSSSTGTSTGSSTGTSGGPPPNACTPGAAGSNPLGGDCTIEGAPGTCLGGAFYCLIDGDAGLCPIDGYVSGYPFAAVLDGGADGGPLGTSQLFDDDAGQPIFPGLCVPTPGTLPLGADCSTSGPGDLFGGCIAGTLCLGTCQATCDVRDPLQCGEPESGKTCHSTQLIGYGQPDSGGIQYPQGVCGGCLPAGYGCALASECCQAGGGLVCFGGQVSPMLDGGFIYGSCGPCTACEDDPVSCPCTVNSDCCNPGDACIGGTCTACIISGASGAAGYCTSSSNCCGVGTGTGGTACVDNSCQACLPSAAACQVGDDCCSGLCDELAFVCG